MGEFEEQALMRRNKSCSNFPSMTVDLNNLFCYRRYQLAPSTWRSHSKIIISPFFCCWYSSFSFPFYSRVVAFILVLKFHSFHLSRNGNGQTFPELFRFYRFGGTLGRKKNTLNEFHLLSWNSWKLILWGKIAHFCLIMANESFLEKFL